VINFENLFLLLLGQRGDVNAGSLIAMLLLKAFNVELFHLIEDQLLLLLDKLKENVFDAHIFDRINEEKRLWDTLQLALCPHSSKKLASGHG
jgi:hypothetical protein